MTATARALLGIASLLLVTGTLFFASGAARATDEIARERREVPPEPAIVMHGVRYQAIHWGKALGFGQNGGFVKATDVADGRLLWILRVYRVNYDTGIEGDRADVFIQSLTADPGGGGLLIRTERGQRYRLDLRTLSTQALP